MPKKRYIVTIFIAYNCDKSPHLDTHGHTAKSQTTLSQQSVFGVKFVPQLEHFKHTKIMFWQAQKLFSGNKLSAKNLFNLSKQNYIFPEEMYLLFFLLSAQTQTNHITHSALLIGHCSAALLFVVSMTVLSPISSQSEKKVRSW